MRRSFSCHVLSQYYVLKLKRKYLKPPSKQLIFFFFFKGIRIVDRVGLWRPSNFFPEAFPISEMLLYFHFVHVVFCMQLNPAHYSSGEFFQCKPLTGLIGKLGPPCNIEKSFPKLWTWRRDSEGCSPSSFGVWSWDRWELLCAHIKSVFPYLTLAASEGLK